MLLTFLSSCSSDDTIEEPTNIYLEIPDPRFEAKLIELGIDTDGQVNQQMLRSDAKKVTHLDLNASTQTEEIEDLTGIEGFTELTFLRAANQKIGEISLASLTQLDTIQLSNNLLTHIDLSENANLIYADIHFNELSSISGLSDISGLKQLDLSWNQFENISIDNSSVEVLFVSYNELTLLDVSKATGLKSLIANINKLTSIDIRNNRSLETVVLSANEIQQIDLQQNPALTHLYISSNLLNSLDVSQNPALVDLRVHGNTTLDCIKIAEDQSIPTVSLSGDQQLNTNCN